MDLTVTSIGKESPWGNGTFVQRNCLDFHQQNCWHVQSALCWAFRPKNANRICHAPVLLNPPHSRTQSFIPQPHLHTFPWFCDIQQELTCSIRYFFPIQNWQHITGFPSILLTPQESQYAFQHICDTLDCWHNNC